MSKATHFHIAAPLTGFALATAALALPVPTQAADLATKAPPPVPVVYNWTGFYVGANFGAATVSEDVATPLGTASPDPSGAIGGGQIGYNFQLAPAWLVGIEGDIDGTSVKGTANVVGAGTAMSLESDHNWYATVTGRLGYVTGAWLFYAKGGVAWLNADEQLSVNSGIAGTQSISATRTGWTAGAGVEYLFSPKWSAKVEYDYLGFDNHDLNFTSLGIATTAKSDVNEFKVGLNYHF
jgi:outer membrane autotransporter protein